jgi:hypothetical protein
VQPTTTPIQVLIANQQYMQSTHTVELPLQGIPSAARQVHVFPNMATNLLAPGPLVQQGCTLTMDSKQCIIQGPKCQPIYCPINSQGLYLLPATAYNTIDVDEYIDRANQTRFATATRELRKTFHNGARQTSSQPMVTRRRISANQPKPPLRSKATSRDGRRQIDLPR